MKCEYCEMIEREEQILYQDKDVLVVVKDTVVHQGQVTVLPKKHYIIMEMVPDNILEKCFLLANKVSVAVFESLGAQGTNIIVQNGLGAGQKAPHFAVEVIARKEGDGLNLQWAPKQMMEDEIEIVYEQLKKEVGKMGQKKEKDKKVKGKEIIIKDDQTEMDLEKEGDDYLVKSLKRIP